MNDIRYILPIGLGKGSLVDALEGIHDVYASAEASTAAFEEASGLACPEGCGTCCESFVPDLTDLEAAYLGAWLLRHKPDLARTLALDGYAESDRTSGRCPLYSLDPLAHCTAYAARPLVCRLFGFAASRAKDGQNVFALCRFMPTPEGRTVRSWKGDAIGSRFGASAPVMADLGALLQSVRPSEGSHRRLLFEALPEALRRVLFLAGLAGREAGDEPEPEPEPLEPLPAAG
jgi:Fe-S-cluster containining protein